MLEGVSELWICYPLTEEETHQYGVRGAMLTQVLHCPYCHETDIVRHGKSPEGKALKFVHRGSYDNMDNTYEAITNHLDDKKLEAKDTFVEEYVTDPLKTAEDKLVINVYVPLR